MNRREMLEASAGLALGLALGGCGERSPKQQLFEEIESLAEGPTKEFIKARLLKYFWGGNQLIYDGINIPLIDPKVAYIKTAETGSSSLSGPDFTPATHPRVLAYTPTAQITVHLPLEFILGPDELGGVQFPQYADHPDGRKIPLVSITYLPKSVYFSFLRPSIQIGDQSPPEFIRFAFVKEMASLALSDAVITHLVSSLKLLHLPMTINAIDVRQKDPIRVEIVSDGFLRIMSRGKRTPALIDIAGYGIAIDALRNDQLVMKYLREKTPLGNMLTRTLGFNFGDKPEEIMGRSLNWVLENPYTRNFPHVGNMTVVP